MNSGLVGDFENIKCHGIALEDNVYCLAEEKYILEFQVAEIYSKINNRRF